MKKEAPLKCKGLRKKTSDEKRGNPKMQGAKKKDFQRKKETPLKRKGLRKNTSDEKRGTPKMQGAKKKDF
jgi:hypothetical protein